MKKEVKIALGIGIPLVVLGGGYLILRKRAKNNGCSKSKFGAKIYGVPHCPSGKIKEEIIVHGDESQASTGDSGSSSGGSSGGAVARVPSTPFKNKLEGDSFRTWVNYKYPEYAKKIKLDSTGSYDNAFIGKAWEKHGQEYLKTIPLPMVKAFLGENATVGVGKVTAKFGDGKYINFMPNGRYWIMAKTPHGVTAPIQKGNYYSGGRVLVATEGKNTGKQFNNGSVWTNIANAIK